MILARKIWQWFSRHHHRLFQNRNIIFIHRGPFEPAAHLTYQVARYENFTYLPDHLCRTIVSRGGEKDLAKDRQELDQNATMWVALIEGQLAGALFTRRGRFFRHWFVPLQAEDIVIFRVRTYPEFRGRGIAPALMRQTMHLLLQPGNNAFVDCRVYNQPSIRCIEKAGFSRIATMKPISRQQALG